MTAWVTIPDGDIDPDSPLTTPLLTALRDNVAASFEKASGAPVLVDDYVTAAMLKTDSLTRSSLTIAASAATIIPEGLYVFTFIAASVDLEVRDSGGTWRGSTTNAFVGGAIISDGVNVRFNNTSIVSTAYYIKMG